MVHFKPTIDKVGNIPWSSLKNETHNSHTHTTVGAHFSNFGTKCG